MIGCLSAILVLGQISCVPQPEPAPQTDAVEMEEAAVATEPAVHDHSDAAAVSHVGPAGILLYCRHQGEIHVLVANDRLGARGWGGFGGGHKPGETAGETAARETSEETRGYYSQRKLQDLIAGQQPIKQWGFYLYVAQVPYVSAATIMEHPLPWFRPAYMETQHYAWIPFSELEPLLTKTPLAEADLKLNPRHLQRNSRSDSYWRVWIDNMRRVHQKEGFPWDR